MSDSLIDKTQLLSRALYVGLNPAHSAILIKKVNDIDNSLKFYQGKYLGKREMFRELEDIVETSKTDQDINIPIFLEKFKHFYSIKIIEDLNNSFDLIFSYMSLDNQKERQEFVDLLK